MSVRVMPCILYMYMFGNLLFSNEKFTTNTIKIFSLMNFQFGKLQSNTLTESIPKIYSQYECERTVHDLNTHPF